MSFFKRLSSGSRSKSYVDDGYESSPHSPSGPKSAFDRYLENNGNHNAAASAAGAALNANSKPESRRQSQNQHNVHSSEFLATQAQTQAQVSPPGSSGTDAAMYQRGQHNQHPDVYAPQGSHSRTVSGSVPANGSGTGLGHSALPDRSVDGAGGAPSLSASGKFEPAPDMLTHAFNMALRPYNDKIDQLEQEVHELREYLATLETERRDMHAWIDKRGLRPDVPPSIAQAMDNSPSASNSPGQAAATLSAQLDRKITIVNFDLHRLQDDLNDSISTSHFASSMLKFLPEISRLAALQQGPRYAFDLILKLGGNLNSHGLGADATNSSTDDHEDTALAENQARRDFFARLDGKMVEVVDARFQEGEDWQVAKEVRRLEKTAAYLRNFGVEPYFPRTLALMKEELAAAGGDAGAGAQQQQQHGASASSAQTNGAAGAAASGGGYADPPKYQ